MKDFFKCAGIVLGFAAFGVVFIGGMIWVEWIQAGVQAEIHQRHHGSDISQWEWFWGGRPPIKKEE